MKYTVTHYDEAHEDLITIHFNAKSEDEVDKIMEKEYSYIPVYDLQTYKSYMEQYKVDDWEQYLYYGCK